MPQMIVWLVRAVGVAIVARWVMNEARRVNAELDAVKARTTGEPPRDGTNLKRDPQTGVFRPSRQ